MTKIYLNDLISIMKEHGGLDDDRVRILKAEITRNDWCHVPGGFFRIYNSHYNVAFFSYVKGEETQIKIDKIIGKSKFPLSVYNESTPFGTVARKITNENGLEFLEEDENYCVVKDYSRKVQAMNLIGSPKQIQDNDELKCQLETLINTQGKITQSRKNFEDLLYEMSK